MNRSRDNLKFVIKIMKIVCQVSGIRYQVSGRRGFTLVEMLVAILLLSFGIAGPLTVASQSIASSRYARDQVIAYNLAQEAVEYIRNLRDNRSLESEDNDNWLSYLSPCLGGVSCTVDTLTGSLGAVSGESNVLWSDGFVYGHSSSGRAQSSFRRQFTISESPTNVEAVVTVTVTWQRGSLPTRSVTLEDKLFNWQP